MLAALWRRTIGVRRAACARGVKRVERVYRRWAAGAVARWSVDTTVVRWMRICSNATPNWTRVARRTGARAGSVSVSWTSIQAAMLSR